MADENDAAEISCERIRTFEKKYQSLKNKIKNQQTVIEILITKDKCADEWKTVKT